METNDVPFSKKTLQTSNNNDLAGLDGPQSGSIGATHTPGPWTIEEYGDDDAPALVIHKDTETRVCFMATPGSHGDPAKIEADARLIAAAPDMLAALQSVLSEYREGYGLTCVEQVRAAIAKAEGRS